MPALLPALFAYMIALGLVLGGGYGALSWLAAPEPVKVVAKAKPKPASAHTASIPEPNLSERSQPQAVEAARAKPASNDQPKSDKPQSSEPGTRVAAREQGAESNQAESTQSEQAADQQAAMHTEASSAEATRSSRAEAAPETAPLASQREPGPEVKESKQEHKQQQNKQPAEAAPPPTTSVAAAAKPKRPHSRQASRPSEKRALALMTLRTIEFPDGRRVTQLIPYRDNRRATAFDPDW
jgi:hypothetical protein